MGTTATPLSSVLEVIVAAVAGFHSRGFASVDEVKKSNPRSAARVFMVPPSTLILSLNYVSYKRRKSKGSIRNNLGEFVIVAPLKAVEMTEERKFAILFAATILAARRLIDMDPEHGKGVLRCR